MRLYHFTSAQHLHGIFKHGLTVGDVVTDLESFEGKIGVWLTSSPTPEGHGLSGSSVDKTAFRLTVDVPDVVPLWKWTEWAAFNLSAETIELLNTPDAHKFDEYYVYFGWLRRETIVEVVSMRTGLPVQEWGRLLSEAESAPAVPFRKRYDWQRRTMRNVRAALALMSMLGSASTH